jgi:hypothetical protein
MDEIDKFDKVTILSSSLIRGLLLLSNEVKVVSVIVKLLFSKLNSSWEDEVRILLNVQEVNVTSDNSDRTIVPLNEVRLESDIVTTEFLKNKHKY